MQVKQHEGADRVLLYARVSKEDQAQKYLSIPQQLEEMRKYCDQQGWLIVKEFVDPGISAKDENCPEFINMVTLAKSKEAQMG
jgi:DNA invertase Pin-like site-specific DNA recombinase